MKNAVFALIALASLSAHANFFGGRYGLDSGPKPQCASETYVQVDGSNFDLHVDDAVYTRQKQCTADVCTWVQATTLTSLLVLEATPVGNVLSQTAYRFTPDFLRMSIEHRAGGSRFQCTYDWINR